MKLAYKLLIANLSIILILVIAMQIFNYVSNKGVLNNFFVDIQSKILEGNASKLSQHYEINNSWELFTQDKNLWRETIVENFKAFDPIFQKTSPNNKTEAKKFGLPPRNFSLFEQKPDDFKAKPKEYRDNFSKMPPPHLFSQPNDRRPPPLEESEHNPFRHFDSFFNRVSLLDSNKNIIIEATIKNAVILTEKIELNGAVIGWLTLNNKAFKNDPIADHYLTKQLEISYWIGALGVLIATLFSYILSRHITAPINLLNQGAQKIAKRDFTTHIKVTSQDEFKALATSVNNISKELLKYDNRQKQWLMDISHELRTPLTILGGELDAMTDGVIPLNKNAITSLQEEVTLMTRLVQDLHELTVIDKTAFECQKDNIQILSLLSLQVTKYNPLFSNKNIELIANIPTQQMTIKGDNDRLSQVIQNILENGLRYINSPGNLHISVDIIESKVQISFADSGPGVAKDALPKLFDRLYRTDESRNRKTGGAGLGLAISRNIILAHNGKIFATLNKQGGLSIHITLPLST
ncbi:MAG: ATP-binding protein [Colwellia sp.]